MHLDDVDEHVQRSLGKNLFGADVVDAEMCEAVERILDEFAESRPRPNRLEEDANRFAAALKAASGADVATRHIVEKLHVAFHLFVVTFDRVRLAAQTRQEAAGRVLLEHTARIEDSRH